MKQQVLIVDDEPELLLSISYGFEKNDRFQITTAHNGREALDILSRNPMDLVVTDLRMPVMDGVELLAAMTETFPKVPNIVMTAFGTPVMEQQLKKAGTMEVLEKPLDIDALEQAINRALDLHEHRNDGLAGITLSNFLQIVAMEQKTAALKVAHPNGKVGFLFFADGKLIDAQYDHLIAEEAAFEMLTWENVCLSMKKLSPPLPEPKIQAELMSLLLEAAHRKDTVKEEKPLDLVKQEFIRIQQQKKKQQQPTGEKKMAGIKELLKEMAGEMDGVLAIQVTGMDGITIALHNPTGTDVEAFSAKFAMVMKLVEKSVDSLQGMGDFEENLVQSQNAWILTRFITPQYYVGIAVSRDGTLGNVRLVAQRYLDQLRKSL
ncbi:MAG: response regulator [Candidatus Electrothrix scaldis]|jgi:CheY-like chemotaxis protein/predicted regulator of Ras-like GTPase activity (Roadblock/LC7/MglB family)|nr:MAG: response regulator [Candidatus Electrothrix sp. GW3-3]